MRVRGLLLVLIVAASPVWAAKRPPKAKPKPAPQAAPRRTAHFLLKSNLPDPYPKAILNLCEATLDAYRDVFGLSLYPNPYPNNKRMVIHAYLKPGESTLSVVTNRKPMELHLSVPSLDALAPPDQGGRHYLFDFAEALGRVPLRLEDANFEEGLCDYLAVYVVDAVQKRLGEKTWPRPYDYVAQDGTGRLVVWAEGASPRSPEAAATLLEAIGRQYGQDVLAKALRLVIDSKERLVTLQGGGGASYRAHRVAFLVQTLLNLTGDSAVPDSFREQHFSTVLDPQNLAAADLWGTEDHAARCQRICTNWGTDAQGLLDGREVELLLQAPPNAAAPVGVNTPDGLTVEAQPGVWTSVWYQPATGRTYIVGRAKVLPSGLLVENDALGPDGKALHLNTKAEPAR